MVPHLIGEDAGCWRKSIVRAARGLIEALTASAVDAARTHVVTAPQAVNFVGINRTPLRFMTA